jgi:transcription elongation factor GreB
MSKAFTRESDDSPDPLPAPKRASTLPPGSRNYLTPEGAKRMRLQLDRLVQIERHRLLALPVEDHRVPLQHLDAEIHRLEYGLASAEIVPPPEPSEDRVRFGAIVTVRERSGAETVYRIVGLDEVDLDRGDVSWVSPMARALLNARKGDRVRLKLPSGEEELEVLDIAYTRNG